MNLEPILNTLAIIGFLQVDAEIYLHLAIKGPQSASAIAEYLKIPKHQVYRSLKYLKQSQIVNLIQEYPTRFSAIPFEDVLNRFQQFSLDDAKRIEMKKQEMLAVWRSIVGPEE